MVNPATARSHKYLDLAMAFRPPVDRSSELMLAYTRLFVGPRKPVAYPYESVYIEGQLGGITCEQVRRFYAEAGLRLSKTQQELPDHISVELAFMAYLAEQEQADTAQTQLWRHKQRRFLHDHLARWLPTFWQKLESDTVHPYYRGAARSLKLLVESDLKRSTSKKRYPNISLHINSQRCTLCTLCQDSCHPGALAVDCTAEELMLLFNPAECNGCRACLRICPEQAVTLDLGQALDKPRLPGQELLASAPRVICPKCLQPHIAAPWLEHLTRRLQDGKFATKSLAYCPPCKTILEYGPGNPASPMLEELVSA